MTPSTDTEAGERKMKDAEVTAGPWPDVEYENDVGPCDEGFSEWWEIPGVGKFDKEADALIALTAVNACFSIAEQTGSTPQAVAAEIEEAFRLLSEAKELFELLPACSDPNDDRCVWLHQVDLLTHKEAGDAE